MTPHDTAQREAQQWQRGFQRAAPKGAAIRACANCRYLAVVFQPHCSLGDFRTYRNAHCNRWSPR